jgi:hypothetical protein
MKRLLSLFFMATLLLCQASIAQEKLYLKFEFMRVDGEQRTDYMETENFWEKIHQQFANNGDIIGWDLWSLQPGGEDQGFQYLVVTLFDNPVSMMKGGSWNKLVATAKKAYPEMAENDIAAKIRHSSKTRDLAVRVYLEQIATTTGDFELDIGTVASIDLMKVDMGKYGDYVKAEKEVFQPRHQKMVDAGQKGSWGLLRVISPIGSETYASHITVNMYSGYEQYFNPPEYDFGTPTEEEMTAVQDGLKTRDMKWVYMATLRKKVRSNSN